MARIRFCWKVLSIDAHKLVDRHTNCEHYAGHLKCVDDRIENWIEKCYQTKWYFELVVGCQAV
ncbi:hypothetical protein BpHYR1_015172 [Brachionus plicatilis]|uniref:Uncharacterized protein n=1 Tax=Brachionus plicatilis TaxID=10195 RepID=A0A3M7QY42_BRAPC|nr:hypothetical protein BpHYR1_015172 [Brachionus plicatilis]